MSITNYSELKTAVANYMLRSDLTSRIPEFIQFAESRIAYGSKIPSMVSEPLRIRSMETSSTLTVAAQTVALPSGYLQSRRLYLATDPIAKLDFVTPDVFWETYMSSTTAQPTAYTIEGENLVFGPTPDGTYSGRILYYKKFDALSGDTDTNWLLTNVPNAYLYGALAEAFGYARAFDKAQLALAQFVGIINALNSSDKADRYATPWVAKTDVGNP